MIETTLTVGQVAGLIGGGTSIIVNTFPLLVSIILVVSLNGQKHNAATWSVMGRMLQSSVWPVMLRADSTVVKHVRKRVTFYSYLLSVAITILVIAHFLTPLPLVAVIRPASDMASVSFRYAADQTYFGQGTPSRSEKAVNRVCGAFDWRACPNQQWNDSLTLDKYNVSMTNSTISNSLTTILMSGTEGTTISGPLDIQYRNYYEKNDPLIDDGKNQIVGAFQPMQSMVLDDSYRIIEGLVVDPVDGGIGFRNHTIPEGLELGATWTEDLLWIQPVTSCTPTNLSLHFSISSARQWSTDRGYMKDDGGFAHLQQQVPEPRWDINGTKATWNISGPIPDLQQRSYLAAWWNNHLMMKALNITNATNLTVGDSYTNGFTNYGSTASPNSIAITDMNGNFYDGAYAYNSSDLVGGLLNGQNLVQMLSQMSQGETSTDFAKELSDYGRRCSGYYDADFADSSKPYIRCGYLMGVPFPTDLKRGFRQDPNSEWEQSLYTCASSVKATVKTVEFRINGTSTLSSLQVKNITDKDWGNNEPLWAVEKVAPADKFMVADVSPLWGIVDPKYQNDPKIQVRPGKELYLPEMMHLQMITQLADGNAAGTGFQAVWNGVYQAVAEVQGSSFLNVPSYSGESQYGLTLKWRELSKTPQGAQHMLNLLFTDLAAALTVGTKTGFTGAGGRPVGAGEREVTKYVNTIQYNNYAYAVPAFIAAFLWLVLFFAVLWLMVTRAFKWRMLHHYMNQTSLGRVATNAAYPEAAAPTAKTDIWLKEAGKLPLDIPRCDSHGNVEEVKPGLPRAPTSKFSEHLQVGHPPATYYPSYPPSSQSSN